MAKFLRKKEVEYMRMSTKGRYGLRLMVALAQHYGKGPLQIDLVSQDESISKNYIRVLMGGLKAAGLVRSVRGTKGGYEITRDPEEITAFQVVSALEEEMLPAPCVNNPENCPLARECATRKIWCRMAACIDKTLKGVTLKELAAQEPEGKGSFPCPF